MVRLQYFLTLKPRTDEQLFLDVSYLLVCTVKY